MSVMSTKQKALARLKDAGIPINQIVDVGVNKETTELIQAFPNLKHLLFEIDPGYNEDIDKAYKSLEHSLYNIGLSDQKQNVYRIAFSIHKNGVRTHTRIASDSVHVDGQEIIQCEKADIERFDSLGLDVATNFLLKIDVDGKDINVLNGFGKCLSDVSVIIIEATAKKIEPVITVARQNNFVLIDIVDRIYYGKSLYQVDLVFVRRDLVTADLVPNIGDFRRELWNVDNGSGALTPTKPANKALYSYPNAADYKKSVRIIANPDWAIIVPDDDFYHDKKLPRFDSVPDLMSALNGGSLRDFFVSSNQGSTVWPGHSAYKLIADTLSNSSVDTILDIGAYAGIFSVVAGALIKKEHARVLAFEPNPANVLLTHLNLMLNSIPNTTVYPFAVGRTISLVDFQVPTGTSISGSVTQGQARPETNRSVVPQINIDTLLSETKDANLAIKIDTEGLEAEVFRGMEQVLGRNHVSLMIFEYHPRTWIEKSSVNMLDGLLRRFKHIAACGAWQFSNKAERVNSVQEIESWLQISGKSYCDVVCISGSN